jgi:HSP20 family protein
MKKKMKNEKNEEKDLGSVGIMKAIGGFLNLISDLIDKDKEEAAGQGEIKSSDGKVKGVYGFRVRMGLGEKPEIDHFGNVRKTDEGIIYDESTEPLTEIMDEGDKIVVIAELPGAAEEDVRVDILENVLTIESKTGNRNYFKEILLTKPVDPGSLNYTCRNGILQATLQVRKKTEK